MPIRRPKQNCNISLTICSAGDYAVLHNELSDIAGFPSLMKYPLGAAVGKLNAAAIQAVDLAVLSGYIKKRKYTP
jgi:hypothetical protein